MGFSLRGLWEGADYIKDLFVYKDGELLWKETRNSRAIKGNVAGCIDSSNGYREIRVNYKRHYAHRLIWAYFNGAIPEGAQIDHINHDSTDNRIENLRVVSHQNNHRNQSIRRNNTSGVTGVGRERGKWVAKIMVDGKSISLGRFTELKEAVEARLEANKLYGFHDNHGKLAGTTDGI